MTSVLVVLTGPTCAGKSYLEGLLSREHGFGRVVSTTTRPPRSGEVNGREYHFVDDAEFNRQIAEGKMVESAFYGVHQYGTSHAAFKAAIEDGSDVVAVLEPLGAAAIRLHCQRSGQPILNVWVAADHETQARRFQQRMASMSEEQTHARLVQMLGREATWSAQAQAGYIPGTLSRFDLEFWGCHDNTNHVGAILRAVNQKGNR